MISHSYVSLKEGTLGFEEFIEEFTNLHLGYTGDMMGTHHLLQLRWKKLVEEIGIGAFQARCELDLGYVACRTMVKFVPL